MSEAAEPQLRSAAEAILIVADEPVTTASIADALGIEERSAEALLEHLAAEYRGEAPGSRAHGFLLRRAAGGWRFASVPEHAELVEQFIIGGATARLSQAALETLAGLIEEAGAEASGAVLYRTTGEFLEYLGIDSLDELPPLAPYLPRVEALGEIVEQADEMAGRRTS